MNLKPVSKEDYTKEINHIDDQINFMINRLFECIEAKKTA